MEKKEAMKILKDFHDKSALFSVRTALETVLPELRESDAVIWDERDYKIRTALFEYLDWLDNQKDCAPKGEFSIRDMIFWLAKVKKIMGNKL